MSREAVYKCAIFIWGFVEDVGINVFILTSVTTLQIVLPSGRAQQKPPVLGARGGQSVHKSQRKVVWEKTC